MTKLTTICRYKYRRIRSMSSHLCIILCSALSALIYLFLSTFTCIEDSTHIQYKRIAVLELVFKHKLNHSIIVENISIPKCTLN